MAKTIKQGFRFTVQELAWLRKEAQRLQCAAGDVLRAALARATFCRTDQPITAAEIEAVKLPIGMAAVSAKVRKFVAGEAKRYHAKRRQQVDAEKISES